jgi:hypothetical protein
MVSTKIPDVWRAAVPARGSLRWLGQKYGNESMQKLRADWHRVSRFFGVGDASGGTPAKTDFEKAYRDRRRRQPAHLASIALAVRLLLTRGGDPTAENELRERPRDLASKGGHHPVVEVLRQAEVARPAGSLFTDEPEDFDPHVVVMKNSTRALDESAVAALESRLGVRLPGEYRGFLKRFNGGMPRPAKFRLRTDDGSGMTCEITRFLAAEGEPSFGEDTDLEATRTRLTDWGLPRRMLPIATVVDEFEGGLLCLSLRGKDRGRLVYYAPTDSSDSTTYPVAKSLNHLFDRMSQRRDSTPAWVRAIDDDDPEAIQAWLAAGGTLKKRYRGRSPLEIAVAEGKLRVVRWFLDQGTKPEAVFRVALEAGQPEVLLDLLGREGFRPAVPASALSGFFLAPAVWHSGDLVGRLIDLGADVNAATAQGLTPLMIAAQHATPEVVSMLLARGARANIWSEQGEMALHRAVCSTSRPEMLEKMRLLIDAGEALFRPWSNLKRRG